MPTLRWSENAARRIARRIVELRSERPIRTAAELAEIVRRCVPRSKDRIDPATRTFQALRIAVNRELESLVLLCMEIHHLAPERRDRPYVSALRLTDGELCHCVIDSFSRGRTGPFINESMS